MAENLKKNFLPFALSNSTIQRLYNVFVSIALFIILIAILDDVERESGTLLRFKFKILTWFFILHTLQIFQNKKWLNFLIQSSLVVFFGYVVWSFIYAFFDPFDIVLKGENGILQKSSGFCMKTSLLIFAFWFTYVMRPKKETSQENI